MHLQSIHLNLIAIAGSFSRRRHRRIQRGESVSWKQDWSHCTFPMCNDLRKNFIVGVTFGTQDDLLSAICRFFVACIGVLMWSVKLWRFLSWQLGYSCVLIHIFIRIYIYKSGKFADWCVYIRYIDVLSRHSAWWYWIEVRGLSSRTDVLAINKELIKVWKT